MKKHTLDVGASLRSRSLPQGRRLFSLLLLFAASFGAVDDGNAKLSEPDVVYFGALSGAVAGSSLTLRLDADGTVLASLALGSAASYLLRVPMDAVDPRAAGCARGGDKASLYLGDKVVRSVVIPERGGLVNLPLSVVPRSARDWNALHPGDDGSGDLNRNGITDLRDFLNGNDPAFVWSALTVSALPDGGISGVPTLNLAGAVSDNGSGFGVKSLTGNGVAATLNNGGFSIALPLVEGANVITTVATDSADHQTIDTRTITLDLAAPGLVVARMADNAVTGRSFADITGTVADATSSVTAVGGDGYPVSATMEGTKFSVSLNLAPGLNTIGLTVTDLAGKTSNAKRTITSETGAPTLEISVPPQDLSTAKGSITLSGSVADAVDGATVTIAVDGRSYTPAVSEDGSFSQNVVLPTDKTYAVLATATDQAGNQATVQRNIVKTPLDASADISYALKVLQFSVGLQTPTAEDYASADVAPLKDGKPDPDGLIDIADVVVTLQKLVGLLAW